MVLPAIIAAARRRGGPGTSTVWSASGPGTVNPVSDTAVTITGVGGTATLASRSLPTIVGRQYRITWTTDTATGAYSVGETSLKWPVPTLTNPTIIDLDTVPPTKTTWTFGATEDVQFLPKNTPWTHDRLQTIGGRNIVMIGGTFKPNNFSSPVATLNFTKNRGTVYVEGVLVDHVDLPGTQEKDALAYYYEAGLALGPNIGNFVVQNCRIDNVKGTGARIHGDCFQPQGDCNFIRFYNCTMRTSYQAFMLEPRNYLGYDINSIELERCEVIKIAEGDPTSWLYYFTETGTPILPITLTDCTVTETATNRAELKWLYPPSTSPNGAVRTGDEVSWPNKPYFGSIRAVLLANTPNYVPASLVGAAYDRNALQGQGTLTGFVLGANSVDFTATDNPTLFRFQRTSIGTVAITNFAINEILSADLIDKTAWVIVAGVTVDTGTGAITITAAGTSLTARQQITTVAGQQYRLDWTISGLCAYTILATTSSGGDIKPLTTCDPAGVYSHTFTAPGTVTWIRLARSTAGTTTISNISLRQI